MGQSEGRARCEERCGAASEKGGCGVNGKENPPDLGHHCTRHPKSVHLPGGYFSKAWGIGVGEGSKKGRSLAVEPRPDRRRAMGRIEHTLLDEGRKSSPTDLRPSPATPPYHTKCQMFLSTTKGRDT